MRIDDFLQGCINILITLIISTLVFFIGYSHGLKDMEKEAIQKHFGRYDLNTNDQVVFKWNEKI
jgi:uncharacterized protein YpmB